MTACVQHTLHVDIECLLDYFIGSIRRVVIGRHHDARVVVQHMQVTKRFDGKSNCITHRCVTAHVACDTGCGSPGLCDGLQSL